jgi:hypothetical protein
LSKVLELGVLERHGLQLVLDAALLLFADVDPLDGHLLRFQSLEHAFFLARVHEEHGTSFALVSRSTSNTVNVCVCVLRAVHLHNPVYGWEIESTSRDVRGEKTAVLGV